MAKSSEGKDGLDRDFAALIAKHQIKTLAELDAYFSVNSAWRGPASTEEDDDDEDYYDEDYVDESIVTDEKDKTIVVAANATSQNKATPALTRSITNSLSFTRANHYCADSKIAKTSTTTTKTSKARKSKAQAKNVIPKEADKGEPLDLSLLSNNAEELNAAMPASKSRGHKGKKIMSLEEMAGLVGRF